MNSQTIRVAVDASPTPSFALWFRYTGPPIRAIRSLRRGNQDEITIEETLLRFGQWVGMLLDRPLLGGETVELAIEHEGQGEIAVAGQLELVPAGSVGPDRPKARRVIDPLEIEVEKRFSAQRELLQKLELISMHRSGASKRLTDAAWAFWYLDAQTAPSLADRRYHFGGTPYWFDHYEQAFRDSSRGPLYCALDARVRQRTSGANPAPAGTTGNSFGVPRMHVAYYSSIIVQTLRDWYGLPAPSPWDSGLAAGVEDFAAGRLHLDRISHPKSSVRRVATTDGVPNSPAFMFYAELGFVALELEVDVPYWEILLPVFVGAQLMYWHAYGTHGVKAPMREYLDQHERGPREVPADLDGTTCRFKGADIQALNTIMTGHVAKMFDDFELCKAGVAPVR